MSKKTPPTIDTAGHTGTAPSDAFETIADAVKAALDSADHEAAAESKSSEAPRAPERLREEKGAPPIPENLQR